MKYIIVGLHSSGKQEVLDALTKDGIECGRLFTNADLSDPRYDFYTDEDVRTIFENNAYVFIKDLGTSSKINCYEGLSLNEFDYNDVFALTPDQFNSIPLVPLKDEVCFIWMDCNDSARRTRYQEEKRQYNFNKQDKVEKTRLSDFIKNIYNFPKSHLLYFFNEDPQRVAAIVYALVKHPELLSIFEKKFN